MTRVEVLVAGGLVLLLGVLMLLGVLDASRRSRDAGVVSFARQAQAFIETYRTTTASYPGKSSDLPPSEAKLLESLRYSAEPIGCSAEKSEACRNYSLTFRLEGPVGTLAGGDCVLRTQEGIRCVKR
jgi:type II secretory pathway pseudopilin PulG